MVKQESHISWDEEGAEASAYTDMGISATSAMIPEGEEVELRLDRPFLFQITSSHASRCSWACAAIRLRSLTACRAVRPPAARRLTERPSRPVPSRPVPVGSFDADVHVKHSFGLLFETCFARNAATQRRTACASCEPARVQ